MNARRAAAPFFEYDVGLGEFDWEARDPVVQLKAMDVDGRDGPIYELSLGALK